MQLALGVAEGEIAPGGVPAPPYGSWWMESTLEGETSREVARFYQEEGLRSETGSGPADYLPDDPACSEHVRVLASASTPAGTPLTCWTYRYNADAASYGDVPDGDWTRLYPPDLPTGTPRDVTGP